MIVEFLPSSSAGLFVLLHSPGIGELEGATLTRLPDFVRCHFLWQTIRTPYLCTAPPDPLSRTTPATVPWLVAHRSSNLFFARIY
jgi:hypothetical protein